MFFDESSLIYGAGTLLGDGDQEIKLLVGKLPLFGEKDSNDPNYIVSEEQWDIKHHTNPFLPCLPRVLNTWVSLNIFNNYDLVLHA